LLAFGQNRKAKHRRHNADDGERAFVQIDRASDDLGVRTKRTPPQVFAEYHGRWRARLAVVRVERASQDRPLAEDREKLRRHDRGVDDRRLAAARQRELVLLAARHVAEDTILLAKLREICIRPTCGIDPGLRLRLEHGEELVRTRIGQWFQEHGINDAKNSRVRAHAESQREDGHGGEARVLTQHAECVARVLEKCFEHG
jgi:hypothetical protein